MKKYKSILRLGSEGTNFLTKEMKIIIFEKLDGANASFKRENGELVLYSRLKRLEDTDDLRGFKEWADSNVDVSLLEEGKQYYGEWLIRHKVKYNEENHNKFYLFDIYSGHYESVEDVKEASRVLGIDMAPILYEGYYISEEHLMSFVGISKLGDDGEGIVVKPYGYLNREGKQVFIKLVSERFNEIKNIKTGNVLPDSISEFIDNVLTEARVEKQLYKYLDEGIIEDLSKEKFGILMGLLGKSVFEDIMKEEFYQIEKKMKKQIGKHLPSALKNILENIEPL